MDSLTRAKNIIQKSQIIFIVPDQKVQGDILGASFGLFYALKKMGKNVNLLLEKIPENFQLLPPPPLVNANPFLKDFIISINNPQAEISRVYYEKDKNNLKFYLTPKNGTIEEKNVFFSAEESKPDLVITLGIEKQNLNIFQDVPVLNIDDIKTLNSSLAETTTILVKSIDENLFSKDAATWLLSGVIWASQNFQNQKTNPKTLETAAYLIEQDANHQKIIHYFHKSKPMSYLKLLGQVLKKISFNSEKEFAWASLTSQDFKNSVSSPLDLALVVKELKTGLFRLPGLLILWEENFSPISIKGIFYSDNPELREKILRNFEGISRGQGILFLDRNPNLDSTQNKILRILTN
ncbi:hypothetical protein KAS79_04030 [Candidatus Parcubacteria bacterium]|nr:hypothetical protein [Candidatus Parcubacteria bacterium]